MVSRVDPWSAMKVGFLLSVALGIAMVVMSAVLWSLMSAMGVFDSINSLASQIIGDGSGQTFDIMDFLGFGRVVSLSVVVAVARNVDRGVAAEVEDDAVASDPGPASEDGSEPATDATTDSGDQAPGGDQ